MQPAPKKSAAVPLVLMGAAAGVVALPALFGGTDVQRNRYATREACIADYSDAQCQDDVPVGTSRSVGATHYYYGPWYRTSSTSDPKDPGPGRYYASHGVRGFSSGGGGGAPAAVESGTRGGFGSHGRVSARS
ncbi:MAG TPA: hypothetical protein VFB32_18275 [Rudaea sp.]|nr:hypothetical protein [Rudaea sp.]